ncbi:PIN domain-containing protein [Pleurocapsales cyanobacterium LEGE 06147]|nr:PIN domain-containing protein [Pleurocapsales cyanobacterium LEGE 06147]
MSAYWVDANILLRLITNDPPEMAARVASFVERAEQGEVILKVSSIVVAEVIWVLISFYGYSREQVADVLIALLTTEGVILESAEQIIAALDRMAAVNVDFVDAYLAEIARRENDSVASFDRDFKRLDVNWIEPD